MAKLIFKCPYIKGGGKNTAHLTHLTNYISTREGVEKKNNYTDYIANRPNVQKIDTHGLFTSGNKPINLSKVKAEISQHKGNVWLPIISLTREDATKTGYDNLETWKTLLEQYALEMAKNLKISDKNFRWYGAFHNHKHHPHIHMIIYSGNTNEGFLKERGIEGIKSMLLKEIFADEMHIILKFNYSTRKLCLII